MKHYYIGIMSGTSLDGIDLALCELSQQSAIRIVQTHTASIPKTLKKTLLSLNKPSYDAITRMATADRTIAQLSAQAVNALLQKTNLSYQQITAIGSHGHNIRHAPNASPAFTLQIGDGNTLAAMTGITTVTDFRRKDIAWGGQGAPLAPGFHKAYFQSDKEDRAILNIGGIANLTILPAKRTQPVIGFDTGPGNTLLDAWCEKHTGQAFDNKGLFALSGTPCPKMLKQCLADSYFQKRAPKSTGREYFNLTWLKQHDAKHLLTPEDVQATLLKLTVDSICLALKPYAAMPLFVCGGGTRNTALMQALERQHPCTVQTTEALDVDPQWVEAAAFAWLAKQTIEKTPSNLPSVTGARSHAILGAVYYSDNAATPCT